MAVATGLARCGTIHAIAVGRVVLNSKPVKAAADRRSFKEAPDVRPRPVPRASLIAMAFVYDADGYVDPKRLDADERRRAALHEGGHAAVSHDQGVDVLYVRPTRIRWKVRPRAGDSPDLVRRHLRAAAGGIATGAYFYCDGEDAGDYDRELMQRWLSEAGYDAAAAADEIEDAIEDAFVIVCKPRLRQHAGHRTAGAPPHPHLP